MANNQIKIRLLKDWQSKKAGDIINISEKGAASAISVGIAEIIRPKISKETEEVIQMVKDMNDGKYIHPSKISKNSPQERKTYECSKCRAILTFPLDRDIKEAKCSFCDSKNFKLLSVSSDVKTEEELNEILKAEEQQERKSINCEHDLMAKGVLDYHPKGDYYTVNINGASEEVIKNLTIKTILGIKDDLIYVYEKGVYKNEGRGYIKAYLEDLLKTYSTNAIINEILEKVKRKTSIKREEFTSPINLLCVENGVLDLSYIKEEVRLLPHSPEYNFETKLPVCYDINAKCDSIKSFLDSTFYPEDIPQVQEWLGHYLLKQYRFKKAVILVGPKDTGKTIFIGIITSFLGEKNISGLSLQKISLGRSFDLMSLRDKLANIYDDLSSKDLSDGGGFKIATGGGYVTGEIKFGDILAFKSYAKLLFACNKIPPMKDNDDLAYFARWLVWRCDNVIPEDEQDKDLKTKLTEPQELSGLLNFALEGLKRLMEQNKFSNPKSEEEIKDLMMRNSSPLSAFVQDYLIREDGAKITKEQMFEAYSSYCQVKKLQRLSKEQLGRQLPLFATYILDKRAKERYWENVKLNNSLTLDTLDTFSKTYRDRKNSINDSKNNIDMLFQDASKSSNPHDTLDTFDKKESNSSTLIAPQIPARVTAGGDGGIPAKKVLAEPFKSREVSL